MNIELYRFMNRFRYMIAKFPAFNFVSVYFIDYSNIYSSIGDPNLCLQYSH